MNLSTVRSGARNRHVFLALGCAIALVGAIAVSSHDRAGWARDHLEGANLQVRAVVPLLANDSGGLRFTRISAGSEHTCGMLADGALLCWGNNSHGQATPPKGQFREVSAASFHSCGVRFDGTVACWGRDWINGPASPPAGTFTSIATAVSYSCGVRSDSSLACWGSGSAGQTSPPSGQFTSVSVGEVAACGLRVDRTAVCWSGFPAPPGEFSSIDVGWFQACGLRRDGTMVCWGPPTQIAAFPGAFLSVSVGGWAQPGVFGASLLCGIRTDGMVTCEGLGQPSPPAGTFASISAGGRHSCALKSDGTVSCWGWDGYGQASSPQSTAPVPPKTPTPGPTATTTPSPTPSPTPRSSAVPTGVISLKLSLESFETVAGPDGWSNYRYSLHNTGSAPVNLDYVIHQSWFSADAVFGGADDCGAAGSIIAAGTLGIGETRSFGFGANLEPNPQYWPQCVERKEGYVIVEIRSRPPYEPASWWASYPVSK